MHDVARNRDPLLRLQDGRLSPFDLDLELAVENEKELVLALVLVPVELAVEHGEPNDGLVHGREGLVEPRLVPGGEGGDIELLELAELVVQVDVVLDHREEHMSGPGSAASRTAACLLRP